MTGPDPDADPRFEERDVLGGGAGGRVVRGHDRHLERHVALKIVAAHDTLGLRRLRREAAILVALEHPGIVPLYDLIERDDGGLQLALRIVRGASLESVLARSRGRDLSVHLRHLARAAEAVAWAHHEGFVHRDLKPANIMIGDFGETQVIDWGLAARGDDVDLGRDAGEPFDPGLTHVGAVLGTPRYMCPEQARGERVDARADVWCLGAILFEIVAGRPAFPERDVARLLDERRGGLVPDLARVAPRAPAELVAIVRRALAPEPEDRYPDARAFAADLNAWLDGRPVAAHRYRLRHRAARFVARRRAALALVGGGLAAVGAFTWASRTEVIEDSARTAALELDLAGERRRLADLSLDEAEASLHRREIPEASAGAMRALDLSAGDPAAEATRARARGVIAITAGAQSLRLQSEIALGPTDCLSRVLHPDRRRWLCRRAGEVALYDGALASWRRAGVFEGAAFVARGERVALLDPARVVTLMMTSDGSPVARLDTGANDPLVIRSGEGAELAVIHGHANFMLLDGERLYQTHRARFHQVAAVARGGRWTILHSDGWLGRGRLDPAAPRTLLAEGMSFGVTAEAPTGLGELVRQVSALAPRDDEVVLGTLHGELLRVGLDGELRARVALRKDAVVTLSGATDRQAGVIAVTLEHGGALIVDATSLQVRVTLPRLDGGAIALADAGHATTLGERLAHWDLGPPRLGALHGFTNLTVITAGGPRLAAGDAHAIRVFDAQDGALLASTVTPAIVKSLALHPTRRELAAGWVDASTIARQADDGSGRLAELPPIDAGMVKRLGYAPDGTLVALPYRRDLWFVPDGDATPVARPGEQFLDLDLRGARAALLSRDKHVVLYALSPAPYERARCDMARGDAVALAADGDTFVVARAGEVALYESDGCALVGWRAAVVDGEPAELVDVAASADGAWLAATSRDGHVFVWDGAGVLRAIVRAHALRGAQVVFADDGRYLYSSGWDDVVQVFDLVALRALYDVAGR